VRILLFKPKGVSDSITPVLGLGYLAAAARQQHEVTVIHGIKEHIGPERFEGRLRETRPDVVGFQVYTHDLAAVSAYLEVIKRHRPDTWVVLGGPHPSAAPGPTLELLQGIRGFVIKGEADRSFPTLMDRCASGAFAATPLDDIPGLVWRQDGRVVENPMRWIEDMDSIPFPAWDLMPPDRFPPSPHAAFYKKLPVAPMIASRGCPYQCVYCAGSITMGKTVRYRSVENVLEEVTHLLRTYGVKEIHFVDDNFTHKRGFVLKLCEEVLRRGLRFYWTCPNGVRLNTLDEELLGAMKAAGCYALAVGIESGSQRILDKMRKGLALDEIRSKVSLIRKAGMTPIGFFVVGFPTETREEMEQTIRYSRGLGLKRANFMLFHPFPGTEAYRWIKERKDRNGLLLAAPSYAEVSYVPEGFTMRELKGIQRKAFLGFYLRPSVLWHLLKDIRSPRHAYYIVRRVARWMGGTSQ